MKVHASSCALHNAPALPVRPCDCGALKTSPELLALIERAKSHVMTPEEIHEQRRSFVRGMCPSTQDYGEWCKLVDRLMPPMVKS